MSIRSQDYAKRAHPLVSDIKNSQDKNLKAKYRTLALNFPNMILQSGLCQAVGFLLAQNGKNNNNEKHHQKLLGHLAELLNAPDGEILHKHILQAELSEYQLLTRKALDAASWLKRYTQALLDKENEKGEKS